MLILVSLLYLLLVLSICLLLDGYGLGIFSMLFLILFFSCLLGLSVDGLYGLEYWLCTDSIVYSGELVLLLIGLFLCMVRLGRDSYEYSLLFLFSIIGLLVMLRSEDLLSFYIGLEIQSLCYYVLIGYNRFSSYGTEASLKYFIVGSVGSGLLLLGFSFIYFSMGTLVFEDIGRLLLLDYSDNDLVIGLVLLLSGIGFKLSAGLFYQWYIDVVEGGFTRSVNMFSTMPKLVIVIFLIRLLGFIDLQWIRLLVLLFGIISLVISVIGCYYQNKIRRFLGYSSIGSIGYILLLVSYVGDYGIVLNYLLVYSLVSVVVWYIVERYRLMYLSDLGLLVNVNGYLGFSMSLMMLSMIGMPPLMGFYIKVDLLLDILFNEGLLISVAIIVLSVLGGYNYLGWIKIMYYDSLVRFRGDRLIVCDYGTSLAVSFILIYIMFGFIII